MCGIAGIWRTQNDSVSIAELKKMTDTIVHRGPDGEGHWLSVNKNVGFGHRRLAIIDLSEGGAQPMSYANHRLTITFNGEIYNYIELKETLQKKGYSFQSRSDTEVVLALYQEYGTHFLPMVDGMFAMAIWDEETQELFCARDRMGEKPFFYYQDQTQFIFGSEIKEIRALQAQVDPDLDKLQSFVNTGQISTQKQSFFKGIKVLSPAHSLLLKGGSIESKRYWSIDLQKKIGHSNQEDMVSEFATLFKTSIDRRMRMDVDYGTSLSGGLDSSAIASVIANRTEKQLKTFSARFKNSDLDEGKWMQYVLNKYQLANEKVYPQFEDLIERIDIITSHQEYPILGSSMHAQWSVMELVKQNRIKVLIDGQGADEFLCGYKEFKYFAIWDAFYQGNLSRFWKEKKLFDQYFSPKENIGMGFLAYPILNRLGKTPKEWQFGTNLRERLKYAVENDLSNLLMSADRNSMAHSIEVRLPFTNHELIEYTFKLPSNLLYENGETKSVLRKSMKDILPEEILSRKDKIGFAPPQSTWLLSEEGKMLVLESEKKLNDYGIQANKSFPWRSISVASFLKTFS